MLQFSEQEKTDRIKRLFWDMDIDAGRLLGLLTGETEELKGLTKNDLYHRILETYEWYEIQRLVSYNDLPNLLNERVLKRLYSKELKERYRYARRVLSERVVSSAML